MTAADGHAKTLADRPVALRRYVIAVILGGPLLAVGVAMSGVNGFRSVDWVPALLLSLLAALAYGRPFRVSHEYSYDVSEVIHVAIVLLFPPQVAGLLVVLASALHLIHRPTRSFDELFNIGQFIIHVTTGALCLAAFRKWADFGPSLGGLAPLGAVLATAAVMLLVNTALVSGAIAFDSGARFWHLWRGGIANVAATSAALAALGVVAALIVRDYPLALLPLALPAGLAQYALRREMQLRAETRAALASLVDVMELQDPHTAGHSARVAALARNLALRLGLTGEEADLIETAGRVHDLGKMALKPALLHKQGPLDEAEWREMRQHPVHGAEVVGRFAGYAGCAELVRHHHEHWDGSGYPCGLAGDQIPIGARILAVADAFDAMMTTRSYRPAKGPDAALRILEEGAGTCWDRRVVQALAEQQREAAPAVATVASRPMVA